MLGLIAAYAAALRYLSQGRAPAGQPPASGKQKVMFGLGMAALWSVSDWPMHDLSEGYLYSAHMVQHIVYTFVAPPLLLLGIPPWMLRMLLGAPKLMAVMRRLTKPLVALILFNALVAFTHWSGVVDASLRSEPLHFSIHLALFSAAMLMWWPVIAPLPELSKLSEPGKILYLFAQSILPTVPASFLTFADRPIYEFYATVPRMWGLSALTDQLIAGLIMKIGGGLLLWSVIAVVFFRWHAKEESDEIDEVEWDDFEHELTALGMRR